MWITPYDFAERYIGVKEVPGNMENPLIMAMLKLDSNWPDDDEVPWCGAFMNWVMWHFRLPRTKDLRARSWLKVGRPVDGLWAAKIGHDFVVLSRGGGKQPGPEVINAPGHTGLFAGVSGKRVLVLAGNQGDSVSIASFDVDRILDIRTLRPLYYDQKVIKT